jgi:hypothetical protein
MSADRAAPKGQLSVAVAATPAEAATALESAVGAGTLRIFPAHTAMATRIDRE